ncbi:RagB/SusD family nutrient uptake outer membrane protein [Parapedobacter sp. 2B3]|uniref:RagB/SusD family nutrient uptake outer membrane protein n=1 Tax=Parapedobacter sp. 2B3 TaxID=3342381 RepID=UPI0035B6AA2A
MKQYKRILFSFIPLVLFSSCSGLLDLEPETQVSDQGVISDKRTSLAALYGIYNNLQSSYPTTVTAFNLAGDNVITYANPTIIVPDRNVEDNGGAPFSALYVTINRANFIIHRVPGVVDNQFTSAERNQIIGEAYFLRALTYFDLARFYGGVQLITKPTERIDTHKGLKRSSLPATYEQVLADLNEAERLITNTTDRSRATVYAVYALKARLFLYTEQWDQAEEYASKTIATSGLALVKPYTAFYTTKLSNESIFEIVFTAADANTYWRSYLSRDDGGNQTYVPEASLIAALRDSERGGTRQQVLRESSQEPGLFAIQLYNKKDGTGSLFVLRLAEQYLIRAEARARKTNADIAAAIEDIRAVQARAEVTSVLELTATSAAEDVLAAIEHERRLELAFEGHRFSDLVRTGRAGEVLGEYNALLKESYQWVFPIPASSVEKDPALEQNPGFE